MPDGNLGQLEWSVRARLDTLDSDLQKGEEKIRRFRSIAERPISINFGGGAGGGRIPAWKQEQNTWTRGANAIERALSGDPREGQAMRQLNGLLPSSAAGDSGAGAADLGGASGGLASLTKGVNRFAAMFALRAVHQAIQTVGAIAQDRIDESFDANEGQRLKQAQKELSKDVFNDAYNALAVTADWFRGDDNTIKNSYSGELAAGQVSLDVEKWSDEQNKLSRDFVEGALSAGLTGGRKAIAQIETKNAKAVYEAKIEHRDILADTSLDPIQKEEKLKLLSNRLTAEQAQDFAEVKEIRFAQQGDRDRLKNETASYRTLAAGGSSSEAERQNLEGEGRIKVAEAKHQLDLVNQTPHATDDDKRDAAYDLKAAQDNAAAALAAFDVQWTRDTLSKSIALKGSLDASWQTLLRNPLGAEVAKLRADRDIALQNPDLTFEQRLSIAGGEQVQEQLALRNQQESRTLSGAQLQGAINVNKLRSQYKGKSAQALQVRQQAEARAEAFRRAGDSANARKALEEGQSEEAVLAAQFKAEKIGDVVSSVGGYYGGPGIKGKRQFYESTGEGVTSTRTQSASLGNDLKNYSPDAPIGGANGLFGGDTNSNGIGTIIAYLQQLVAVITGTH